MPSNVRYVINNYYADILSCIYNDNSVDGDQYLGFRAGTQVLELSRSSNLPLSEACRQVGEESHVNPKTIRTAVYRLLSPRNKATATSLLRVA
jgi:hypothetical protein